MKNLKQMLAEIPCHERTEMFATYSSQKKILKQIFPRGRFRMFEDGRCVLASLNKRFREDYVFIWNPSQVINNLAEVKLGLCTTRHYSFWHDQLKPWMCAPPLPCDDNEGIIYFYAQRGRGVELPLQTFMKGKGNDPMGLKLKKRPQEAF